MHVNNPEDALAVKFNFLTDCAGRGLFHIFQGLLWAGLAEPKCFLYDFIVAVLEIFLGLVYIYVGTKSKSVNQNDELINFVEFLLPSKNWQQFAN